ncbi:ubiquitin-protein ligase peroxin 12 [Puccinia graminis f. sp. tritici]|uniref:Peroxisome assembly protein 12 n=2 Tax=Puccinia graminis f. sp. tritici TaxID=56615 RepID=A0A5B0QE03_PUCGR|nr:ubiquitin-protein ligase peroxin 12 [Puccinia graminis f. sp. tritici]
MDPNEEELYRPTFFELVAQDQLRELIGPVIRYVTSVFAQRYPRYLIKLLNHHDEVFAVMMYFIERYYLKNWCGSFAENFYGLSRRRHRIAKPVSLPDSTVGPQADPGRLAPHNVRLSLIFLVAIPYLRAKAAGLHEALGGGPVNDDLLDDEPERPSPLSNTDDSRMERIKSTTLNCFKSSYPYFIAMTEFSHLIFGLRYLFGKSPYWRASQAYTGIEIRRTSAHDQGRMQHKLDSQKISPFARDLATGHRPNWRLILRRFQSMISHRFFESLKVLLPGSIFFFKFLEWWYSSSNTSRYRPSFSNSNGTQFPAIQPPVPLKPQVKGILGDGTALTKPIPKGHCPICRTKLSNPTAVPSGWVYCYKCIHPYVVEYQQCPVTHFPTNLTNLRKIIG